ncbi:hypothetical protein CDL12_13862 [Handroanthus impetiginosus]|uniref:Retrotransposon gag domain-containing protein n=1 Tax=Handroanthus impetiginosus TaxID=429701 RepID=A0A2G9H7N5_9LAMI|nr:hypothetical protein CDL12_13862 [Handroanthus impetiginosus]
MLAGEKHIQNQLDQIMEGGLKVTKSEGGSSQNHKVPLASVYFQGKAEVWFQNFIEGRSLPSWDELVVAVLERFDDVALELIIGEFNKLQQIGIVTDYFEKFDDLRAHMLMFDKDFKESHFVTSFISGLKEEIKGFVSVALALVKKYESSIKALLNKINAQQNTTVEPLVRTVYPQPNPLPRNFSTFLGLNNNIPIHKQRRLYMMMTEEEEETYTASSRCENQFRKDVLMDNGKISLNALLGSMGKDSSRLNRVTEGKQVQILIDNGSTYSFIDETIATSVGAVCSELTWHIQNLKFTYVVKVIKLGGCDMILRYDWLWKHGPVLLDLDNMRINIK